MSRLIEAIGKAQLTFLVVFIGGGLIFALLGLIIYEIIWVINWVEEMLANSTELNEKHREVAVGLFSLLWALAHFGAAFAFIWVALDGAGKRKKD